MEIIIKIKNFFALFSYFKINVFCNGRKMMNRIAAQNARDRKKSYVVDLERRVAELEAKVSCNLGDSRELTINCIFGPSVYRIRGCRKKTGHFAKRQIL